MCRKGKTKMWRRCVPILFYLFSKEKDFSFFPISLRRGFLFNFPGLTPFASLHLQWLMWTFDLIVFTFFLFPGGSPVCATTVWFSCFFPNVGFVDWTLYCTDCLNFLLHEYWDYYGSFLFILLIDFDNILFSFSP